jgi:RNA polymerase sigma-70 factor, ECF subfamily
MDEDLVIVNRIKNGHADAFSLLVKKYEKPVLNLVYRISGNADEAEDLAQEVFLRAFKGISGFKADAKFFTWLYRIAVNVTLRARERRNKFVFHSLDQKTDEGNKAVFQALACENSPSDDVERLELQKVVKSAINELPDDQRMAVILYRYHNLSYEEVANVLEITVPAVKSRLHRSRKFLKDKLQDYMTA